KLMLFQTKYSEAVEYSDKALRTATLRGTRAAAYVIKGMAYLFQKNSTEAIAAAESALKESGDDKQIQGYAYAIKGMGQILQGDTADGKWAITRARQLLPDDPLIKSIADQAGVPG